MYLLGRGETVELKRRQKEILSNLGIENVGKLPKAWKWMATRPDADYESFIHCFFKADYPYTSEIYASLLGEAPFYRLEKWMQSQGYIPYVIKDSTATDCKITLTYANPLWGNDKPRGGFEYKIKHTGISVRYDPYFSDPCIIGLCIPNGLKNYLNHLEEISPSLQEFVLKHTKKCNGCRYCVQTDKTKSRPLNFITVKHGEKQENLCPYFPGYRFCWTELNDSLTDNIIGMLEFMDRFAKK